MTAMPAPSNLDTKGRERIGDNLWYVLPSGERYISVTSVLDGLDDTDLGEFWKPELAARAAVDNLPRLVRASMLVPCGKTPRGWRRTPACQSGEDGHDPSVRCSECPCGECMPCLVVWLRDEHYRRRRDALGRGSAVHDWIEQWVLHGGQYDIDEIAEPYQPYIRSFLLFVEDFGLTPESWEMAETKVLHRTHGWAGTTDGAIRFDAAASREARELCERFGLARPLLLYDWHTREKDEPRFDGSKALQVGVYRRAEYVVMPDWTEVPMPATDGGIIVQLRPDGYDYRPVLTEDDDYEQGFLARLRNKLWALQRLDVLASVWHYPRDQYGRPQTDQGRVVTFPRREIPGMEPAKPKKRTAAARSRAAKATVTQPALADKSEQEFAVVATASGRRAPDPRSPYGDDIPF